MIETARLMLRPTNPDDLELYCALLTDDEVTQFLPFGQPYRDEVIRKELMNRIAHWQQYEFGTFTIIRKSDGKKLGYVGVEETNSPTCFDIRFAVVPQEQDKGVAFEAAFACLDFTFKQGRMERIYGVAIPQNNRSVHLLEKLNMHPHLGIDFYSDDSLSYFSATNPHL